MTLIATCLCGKQFRLPDSAAGQVMNCPVCVARVLVPSLDPAQSPGSLTGLLPAVERCVDCGGRFEPAELIRDQGESVCPACFTDGPPRREVAPGVKRGLWIAAAVLSFLALNLGMAYYLFVLSG